MVTIKAERWMLSSKGFIIYDIIRREILFTDYKEDVELFFKSTKRNKKEYRVVPVDFIEQDFPDEILKMCSNGMLVLCYGKAITPNEEEEFIHYIDLFPSECYYTLSRIVEKIEDIPLSKKERKFIVNTIHRLFGFVGSLEDEIENSIEYDRKYIRSLNLERTLDKALELENSKEMREEYNRVIRRKE